MTCPECNGKTRVTDCVHTANNETCRIRKCRVCGYKFGTLEFPVDRDPIFKEAWNTYHRKNLNKQKGD